jgi:hypothetical protein
MRLVEGHLAPEFVKRCQQKLTKHSRGAIVDWIRSASKNRIRCPRNAGCRDLAPTRGLCR